MNTTTIVLLALLLACPLMMLFMHRGGKHSDSGRDLDPTTQADAAAIERDAGAPDGDTPEDDANDRRHRLARRR